MKFSEQLLKNIGNSTLALIEDNIKKGVDVDGKSFAYSEKPFYRPYDPAIYKALRKDQSFAKVITGKEGKLGFIVFGYKKFKEKFAPDSKNNFLTWSGKMLRNMNVLSYNGDQIIIGFNDPLQSQKAYWLNISGAGKSRKLWKFLGLREEQIVMLAKKYEGEITKEVALELTKKILNKN